MLLNCMGDADLHFDSDNDRVRQIATVYVDQLVVLDRLLSSADVFATEHDATRIVVRALTHRDCLLSAIALARARGYRVESVMPVGGVFADYSLVAYGRNLRIRFSTPAVVLQQQQMLIELRANPKRKNAEEIVSEAKASGWDIERLGGPITAPDREDLMTMIRSSLQEHPEAFEDELDVLLNEPDRYTAVALRSHHTGRLHSLCMTERKNLVMCDGRALMLDEKAWAVKHHHGGIDACKGLSIILHLALQLDSCRRGTHLLFAESRSALAAINRINHCIGMRPAGMLEKHVAIGGDEDIVEAELDGHSVYRNMNVWFMTYDDLQATGPQLEALLH